VDVEIIINSSFFFVWEKIVIIFGVVGRVGVSFGFLRFLIDIFFNLSLVLRNG